MWFRRLPGTEPGIDDGLPGSDVVEQALIEKALEPFLEEIQQTRLKEIDTISTHMEISLNELIHRQNLRMAELMSGDHSREANPLLAANIKQVEDKIDELNNRLESGGTRLSGNGSAPLRISSTTAARGCCPIPNGRHRSLPRW
jgi:hypothetical protein